VCVNQSPTLVRWSRLLGTAKRRQSLRRTKTLESFERLKPSQGITSNAIIEGKSGKGRGPIKSIG